MQQQVTGHHCLLSVTVSDELLL